MKTKCSGNDSSAGAQRAECPYSAVSLSEESCNECNLTACPPGARVRIRDLRGCGETMSRLCALGFTPGATVTVYENNGGQGCRVEVRDTSVVLDRGSADTIVCERAT